MKTVLWHWATMLVVVCVHTQAFMAGISRGGSLRHKLSLFCSLPSVVISDID